MSAYTFHMEIAQQEEVDVSTHADSTVQKLFGREKVVTTVNGVTDSLELAASIIEQIAFAVRTHE